MVPTTSAFADPSIGGETSPPEQDFYLHLHLPPELDLPLPATTQIYHQPPTSYLIPRWDLGPDSGAFTRIAFPSVESRKGIQEDVDTFETILAQCTAFLERAPPPKMSSTAAAGKREAQKQWWEEDGGSGSVKGKSVAAKAAEAAGEALPAYNPADFKPGEGYVRGSHSGIAPGQIVLVDEEDGSVIGELADGFQVVEASGLKPGSKGAYSLLFIPHIPVTDTLPQTPSKSPSPPKAAPKSTSRPSPPNSTKPSSTRPTRNPSSSPTPPPPPASSSPAPTCSRASSSPKPTASPKRPPPPPSP